MFKRIKSFLYLSVALVVLSNLLGGCKKNTFNINDINPNAPVAADLNPGIVFTGAEAMSANLICGGTAENSNFPGDNGSEDYMDLYMGYWAVSGDYIPQVQTLTYNTSTSYGSGNWDLAYQNLMNYRQVENIAGSDPTQVFYLAMAKIMEGLIYERLVDQYNDVPYTQALTTSFPAYDKGLTVYTNVIAKLDSAITLINNAPASAVSTSGYDIIFNGNMTEWVQFANTIKLKMALNLTKSSSGSSLIQTALQGLTSSSFLGLGQDVTCNPGYSNASNNQQSPFYQDMGFNTSGSPQNNQSYYRACSYIVNYMYALNDTLRLYQIFAPNSQTPAVVLGRPFGSNVSVGQDNQHISGMGPGLLATPESPAILLPACESLFMQAEATLEGYLPGGNTVADSLYQRGVEESFRLLQVPNYQAAADNYIATNTSNLANISIASNPLQTIIFQEWIAVSGFDPLASWNNWRRLGIPTDLPVSIYAGTTATHIPYRLLYPLSEYSFNSANVNAEGTINNMTSKIFWMP